MVGDVDTTCNSEGDEWFAQILPPEVRFPTMVLGVL